MVGQADDSEELVSMTSGGGDDNGDDTRIDVSGEGAAGGTGGGAGGASSADRKGSGADADVAAVGGLNREEDATFDGDGSTSVGATQATQMMINMKAPPDHLDFATILPSLAEIRGA